MPDKFDDSINNVMPAKAGIWAFLLYIISIITPRAIMMFRSNKILNSTDINKNPYNYLTNPTGDAIYRRQVNTNDKESTCCAIQLKCKEKNQHTAADWAMLPHINSVSPNQQIKILQNTVDALIANQSSIKAHVKIAWQDKNRLYCIKNETAPNFCINYLIIVNKMTNTAESIKLEDRIYQQGLDIVNEKAFIVSSTCSQLNLDCIRETILSYQRIWSSASAWDFLDLVALFNKILPKDKDKNISIAITPITPFTTIAIFHGHSIKGLSEALRLKDNFFKLLFDFSSKETILYNLANIIDRKNFLTALQKYLSLPLITHEDILSLFDEIRVRDGKYQFIHQSIYPYLDGFRLFFKYNFNDEEKFWHTATYQNAIKLMQAAYLYKGILKNDSQLDEEREFLNYFTGNLPKQVWNITTKKNYNI